MKTKTSITTDGSRGENKKRSAKGKVGQILSGSQKINEIEHAEHTLVAEERGGGEWKQETTGPEDQHLE